ncbi:MAG: GNAT family N-acetyltransferase [Nitrospira sp.]|nr:GNAT family N-acetyltransferase [Nitrospira sp.]
MIIPADESHLDAAWELIDRCRTMLRVHGILQWDEMYPTREIVAADIAERRLYVLIVHTRPQAVVTVDQTQEAQYTTMPWTSPEPALVVHRLCVDPTAQGHGFGGQLMDYVETHAEHHRFGSVRLDAYSGNPLALAFYRERGYREVGHVFFPRRSRPFYCFELDIQSTQD